MIRHARTVLLYWLDKSVLLYLLLQDCPAGFDVARLFFLFATQEISAWFSASLICYERTVLLDLLEQDLPALFTMRFALLDLLWQDCLA